MSNPTCPYCSTEMKFLKEKVIKYFDENDSQSPRTKVYYCDSGLTIYCHGNIS